MSKSITMSFSAPLELSIQMEEHMERSGFNRSELIKLALTSYFKSQTAKEQFNKLIENTHNIVIEINSKLDQLTKG